LFLSKSVSAGSAGVGFSYLNLPTPIGIVTLADDWSFGDSRCASSLSVYRSKTSETDSGEECRKVSVGDVSGLPIADYGLGMEEDVEHAWNRRSGGSILVRTNPLGLTVRLDGEEIGTTPISITVPSGDHIVEMIDVSGRLVSVRREISVFAGSIHTLDHKLEVAKTRVWINTDPAGGSVVINGLVLGPAPVDAVVNAGSHAVIEARWGQHAGECQGSCRVTAWS